MREEEKEIISAERVRKSYLYIYKNEVIINSVFIFVLLILITALTAMILSVQGEMWYILFCFSSVAALLFVCVVYCVIPAVKDIKTYFRYKNAELEVVRATVSLKTARVEMEGHGLHRKAINRHYMFFKDYGETLCGSSAKEGDVYYLVVDKKHGGKILAKYSPEFYRMG